MSNETRAVSPAVQILCQQVVARFLGEQEQLAKIAFETDKLDPADGYRLDVVNAVYVKPEIAPVIQPAAEPAPAV